MVTFSSDASPLNLKKVTSPSPPLAGLPLRAKVELLMRMPVGLAGFASKPKMPRPSEPLSDTVEAVISRPVNSASELVSCTPKTPLFVMVLPVMRTLPRVAVPARSRPEKLLLTAARLLN